MKSTFDEVASLINKPFFNVERHEGGNSEEKVFKVRISILINESYFTTRLSKKDALVLAESIVKVANGLPDDKVEE